MRKRRGGCLGVEEREDGCRLVGAVRGRIGREPTLSLFGSIGPRLPHRSLFPPHRHRLPQHNIHHDPQIIRVNPIPGPLHRKDQVKKLGNQQLHARVFGAVEDEDCVFRQGFCGVETGDDERDDGVFGRGGFGDELFVEDELGWEGRVGLEWRLRGRETEAMETYDKANDGVVVVFEFFADISRLFDQVKEELEEFLVDKRCWYPRNERISSRPPCARFNSLPT